MPEQLPITTYGMDILRKEVKPIEKVGVDLIELVNNMFYTMYNAEGIGLAAPQVNEDLSLCIIDVSPLDEYKHIKPITLINPVILDKHGEDVHEEGCLSIPTVRGNVKRPEKIFLQFHDFDMNEIRMEFSGFFARVIQHEIDHLHGIMFVDLLEEDEKKKVQSALRRIKKNKIIPDYPVFPEQKKIFGF